MVSLLLRNKWRLGLTALGLFVFLIAELSPPPVFAEYKKSFSLSDSYLFSADGRLISRTRIDFNKRNFTWTDYDNINPHFIESLINQEDKRFFQHFGVDFAALGSSAFESSKLLFGAGKLRGGSTISMQLAKHFYKLNTRSLSGKVRQMLGSLMLESRWNKKQILEAYLNIIYFRGELQGVGTASLSLFNKTPLYINENEQQTLLKLIRNPNQKLNSELKINTAPNEELAVHYHKFLRSKKPFNSHTSINYELQKLAVSAVNHQLNNLKERNVHDAAVIVIDNRTSDILAYVGGSGTEHSLTPFVDMVQAERQVGSVLKPLLYATALENRILDLNSWIEDSPVDIVFQNGTYSPRNHDQQFHGWVHPGTALGSSLNVPAVKVIQMVGVDDFWSNLKRLGFSLDHEPDFYGPSLALGTLDANLWTLTHAYQNFMGTSPMPFSDETKRKITWMLSRAQNRAVTFGQDSILNVPQGFAVKTGTSKDMKDNWCVGFNRDYSVGVWVGNADNSSMQNVLGTTGAAPIWRDVVNFLVKTRQSRELLVSADDENNFAAIEKSGGEPKAYGANKIVSPASDTIYAFDPAIPSQAQKIILEATGPQEKLVWKYKGQPITSHFWNLQRGRQKIELYKSGKKVDETTFLVK